jgi:ParB family chromosome partitioning protein
MTDKPIQRRGLGRGLGSLIPTGPRPQPEHPAAGGPPETVGGTVSAPTALLDEPAPNGSVRGPVAPASADWIGVPLPGDDVASPSTQPQDRAADLPSAGGEREPVGPVVGDSQGPDGSATSAPTDGGAEQRPGPEPAETGSVAVSAEPAASPGGSVTGAWYAELPVGDIRPNPRQPREVFDEEAMAELVHSIREVGLLQPVVVRPLGDDRYELVMGERRWRATQRAGLTTIPAIVRDTGDEALLRDALLENLHRAELNPLEEAAAYSQLLEDFGCTHDELASRIGRSRPQISNTIRLLKLSPAVQRRVAAGVLSAGHARALLAVDTHDAQDRLASRVVAEGISVRSLEELVAVGELGTRPAPARRSRPTAPGVDDLAARLSDLLDTRVRVDLGRRKGRIVVEFASLPDLERIVAIIDPGHPTRTRRPDPDDPTVD